MTEDQQILTKQIKPLAPGNSIKVGQLLVFVANYTKILPNEDGEGGEGGEGGVGDSEADSPEASSSSRIFKKNREGQRQGSLCSPRVAFHLFTLHRSQLKSPAPP